jgi:peptidoglycan/LPS O-acetylase OafA/YrhL
VRRSRGRTILAVAFALLAANAWAQVALVALGHSDDPGALTTLQALIGLSAVAAAWGSWAGRRWAPGAAVAYGLITGGMIASLGPLLDLEPDARGGLWVGGAAVLVLAIGCAWYLRRTTREVPAEAGSRVSV